MLNLSGFRVFRFISKYNNCTLFNSAAHKMTGSNRWQPPKGSSKRPLFVYNSLTNSKVEFVPETDSKVGWYSCGPTVYDVSHMGHARAYITFDIMRRIMRDYFKYNVQYVMNITDIDDKIIIGARQKYLLDLYVQEHGTLKSAAKVVADIEASLKIYSSDKTGGLFQVESTGDVEALLRTLSSDAATLSDWADKVGEKHSLYRKNLEQSLQALVAVKDATDDDSVQSAIRSASSILCPWLDKTKGEQVTDPAVFRDYAAFWEREFFKDMAALNVDRPDVLTRVSEYVPEIVDYIKKIIDNGFGYEANGSVYFDTVAFDDDPRHTYCKLKPTSKGNTKLLEEGEGALTSTVGKRHPNDFALWKAYKAGEPVWQSPWGPGRPGWHIECSVMAGDVLGSKLDIHSGGIDLCFPHHDNEIAQSEAYLDSEQWVNYFLHAGHLHIEGQKMSKSLKNFVTIREALLKYTATQIRLLFLMQQWNAVLDYKESSMVAVLSFESTFKTFLETSKGYLMEAESEESICQQHSFREAEKKLYAFLDETVVKVHAALADSFDTPLVLKLLSELVSKTNLYFADTVKSSSRAVVNADVVRKVRCYVKELLEMFGLDICPESASSRAKLCAEEVALPYLKVLSQFRDKVRKLAKEEASSSAYLLAADKLRDENLVELGVALDDRVDGKALIRFASRESLTQLRDQKLTKQSSQRLNKEKMAQEMELKRQQRLEKGKTLPSQLFRDEKMYGAWDENGVPTHEADKVTELPKSRRKKLIKEFEQQKKLHEEYLKSL